MSGNRSLECIKIRKENEMKIVKANARLINPFTKYMTDDSYMECLVKHIEEVGRKCYKSEDKMTSDSFVPFVRDLIKRGHEAMLEHSCFSVCFVVDRGISHEIVRHRMASFAQESTRYCNYGKGKFGNEITVIEPCFYKRDTQQFNQWEESCLKAEEIYCNLTNLLGGIAQEARSVLPNSLKTEVVMTANFREWRHFFKLRAEGITGMPHPQMLEVTVPLLQELQSICPVIFEDIVAK